MMSDTMKRMAAIKGERRMRKKPRRTQVRLTGDQLSSLLAAWYFACEEDRKAFDHERESIGDLLQDAAYRMDAACDHDWPAKVTDENWNERNGDVCGKCGLFRGWVL